MKRLSALLLLIAALTLPAYALHAENGDADRQEAKGKEEKIALKDLPKAVLEAAQGAVKGVELTAAEKITRGATVVYEIDGKVGDKHYEIVVSAEGKVLKVTEEKPEATEAGDGKNKPDDDKDDDADDENEEADDNDD